jgi:hypothetical protein
MRILRRISCIAHLAASLAVHPGQLVDVYIGAAVDRDRDEKGC